MDERKGGMRAHALPWPPQCLDGTPPIQPFFTYVHFDIDMKLDKNIGL